MRWHSHGTVSLLAGKEEKVEDPILTVTGKEDRFSAIMEDLTSDMTAEEYTLRGETLSSME